MELSLAQRLDGLFLVTLPYSPLRIDSLSSALESTSTGQSPIGLLDSNLLNGLEPCQELLVYAAFGTREQGEQLVASLAATGFPWELRYAGSFVGRQDRLAESCERQPLPLKCGDLGFVQLHDGVPYLALSPQAAGAPAWNPDRLEPLGSPDTWALSLDVGSLGGYSTGDGVDLWDPEAAGTTGAAVSCVVSGFSVLVSGTPHHAYLQSAVAPTGPACGEPGFFADLDCPSIPLGSWALAQPRGSVEPAWGLGGETLSDPLLSRMVRDELADDPLLRDLYQQARQEAFQGHEGVRRGTRVTRYSLQGSSLLLVEVALRAGRPDEVCTGTTTTADFAGLYLDEGGSLGELLLPLRDISGYTVEGLMDLERDGHPELLLRSWNGSLEIRGRPEGGLCGMYRAYCDNPC